MREQVIAEIHVVPLGTANTSLSRYIAACLDTVKQAQDISYQLTAMGTKRVTTTMTIDDRRDTPATMEDKVKGVLSKSSSR